MGVFSVLTGALVNAGGIILGSALGLLIGKKMPKSIGDTLMAALGLCVLYIGISGTLKSDNILVMIVSMILGTVIGELCQLDRHINRMGERLENRISRGKQPIPIAQGFVSACLLFCIGAMTIIGSLESGLTGDHTTLYAKTCLDTVAAVIFASTMGVGVMFSSVVVLVLQGGMALLAHTVAPFMSSAVIAEITGVGSLLIIGLALNMLHLTKLKVMNLVPAVFLPILLCPLYDWIAAHLAALFG